ncbi:MAG: caspase family protein [Rectinemataceae bacterium]
MRRFQLPFLAALLLALAGCSLPEAPGNRHAILIGITNYKEVRSLTYPGNDLADMKALLARSGWTVDLALSDARATKTGIRNGISGLAGALDADSSVVVYYSGHGDSEAGTGYIIPYDTRISGSNPVVSTMISTTELKSWISALPARNKLLILDSCYSGSFVDQVTTIDSAPANYGPKDGGVDAGMLATAFANGARLLSMALSDSGNPDILTISAAGSGELSYDDDVNKHGAFSYWLIRAGDDAAADADRNGLVTALEVYAYAKAMLIANWNSRNYDQFSGSYDLVTGFRLYQDFLPRVSGGSGDFVLYDRR